MGSLRRNVGDDVVGVSSTFSSFDQCMAKDYCKIPFIVICVVVGLVVFSIMWCLFRCCLCGYRCCACCCGGCGGRHERRRDRGQSDRDLSQPAAIIVQQPSYHEPPQYAYFDRGNDDALPIMPSLEKTQRIEVLVKEEHELSPMKYGNVQDPSSRQAYGYDQPTRDMQYPSNGLQHPSPVRGYAQEDYGGQMPHYRDPYSGRHQEMGYQENGILHHGNNGYQESPNHHQEQPHWNGYPQTHDTKNNYTNTYQYQGPNRQQHSDYTNHQNQRRQEEWTAV